ncbi:MAG TPA: ribonuclease domain-containing protein [Wenzhouxiangella sp.]|nr:ribonuclease domain-containing protein [Wenzhouxiangella sp.]
MSKRFRRLKFTIALIAVVGLLLAWQAGWLPSGLTDGVPGRVQVYSDEGLPGFLPPEAGPVIDRIRAGGPWPHTQDGSTFYNRERLLPSRPQGYYREFTVPTPGARTRGARRIVTGGHPPEVYYYTADHYKSFRRFEVADD